VRSVEGLLAKIDSCKLLLSVVAIFVIATSSNLLTSTFAWTVSNDYYSHDHATGLTNPTEVCRDHKCAPGEITQHHKGGMKSVSLTNLSNVQSKKILKGLGIVLRHLILDFE
jgi:hypothetical protein